MKYWSKLYGTIRGVVNNILQLDSMNDDLLGAVERYKVCVKVRLLSATPRGRRSPQLYRVGRQSEVEYPLAQD